MNEEELKQPEVPPYEVKKLVKKPDGTFIIDYNGSPCHITPDFPKPGSTDMKGCEWVNIRRKIREHPELLEIVKENDLMPTITYPYNKDMIISTLQGEVDRRLREIAVGIDVDNNQQVVHDLMLEIEELKGNI